MNKSNPLARLAMIEATTMAPPSGKVAVRSASVFRQVMERADMAAIKSAAAIPDRCGPDIAPAPARGAFALYAPREMVPGSTERQRHAGFMGRDAIRAADAFDLMEAQARRAWAGRPEKDRPPFVPPFADNQVTIGRQYAALVERHSKGGVRCASLEAGRTGTGNGGDFMDAFAHEGDRIRRLRERIGMGAALEVRRLRPSVRGLRQRGIITDRALVDLVCLEGLTLSAVLLRFGWAKSGAHIERLRLALGKALDRMQGVASLATQHRG